VAPPPVLAALPAWPQSAAPTSPLPPQPLPAAEADATVKPLNWRTRICMKWEYSGYCRFGNKCAFAHGETGQYLCKNGHKRAEGCCNKLSFVPTEISDDGSEVMIFDEALVDKSSAQWKLTMCGHFVGYKMNVHESRYHIRRMWSKWGIDDIDMKADGMCMVKFKNEEGMKKVLDSGTWLVNNKPLVVRKWDPAFGMEMVEQTKVPIWARLVNVPMEAWSAEGISALASSLGKPLIMDNMTAKRCQFELRSEEEIAEEEIAEEERKREVMVKQRNERNMTRKTNFNVEKEQIKNGKIQDKEVGVQSTNKYAVLEELEDESVELVKSKGRMIVDVFLNKKLQPNIIENKDWTQNMVKYFKKQWKNDRQKEEEEMNVDIEDVMEGTSGIAKELSTE
nr:zinc knuckle CX2CX4HX4C [Tanacetum cinerariifolium]